MNRFYLLKSIPLVIIVSFGLTLILGSLILWPRFQDLRLLNKQIGEMQVQLQSQENYFSKLNDTKAEFKT